MAKAGRPTKYNEDILVKANEYIDSCVDEKIRVVKFESDKSTGYEQKLVVNLPTIEGLALYLGVSRQVLYDWSKVHDKFLYTLGEIEKKQKEILIAKGLSGDYNSTIAKLMLNSNHGMTEKSDYSGEIKVKQVLVKFIDGKTENN